MGTSNKPSQSSSDQKELEPGWANTPDSVLLVKGAALSSLLLGILLMIFKFWGYRQSGSQSVFSDAMESIVNVVAAGLALFVVHYSSKPADQDHPYGHGKVEFFSAAFEGGLISFAGVLIFIEAVNSIINEQLIHDPGIGLIVVAVAGLGNMSLGFVLLRIGRRHRSLALVASGKHLLADFWTSVGVLGGLGLVYWTHLTWIDNATAILIGVLLIWEGAKLVRRSVGGLLDEEDLEVLGQLENIFSRLAVGGIIQIHHVKVIRSGAFHHIDAHLVIPEFWDITEAHLRTTKFEKQVINYYPYEGEINFHLDPCRRAYCQVCDLTDCPIRTEAFVQRMPVRLEHLRSKVEPKEFL